jgi:Glycosyltransferase family 87
VSWLLSFSPKLGLGALDSPLSWWERSLIGVLVVAIVAYGLSLLINVAPSQELQSALQAGWNVLHDKGMYDSSSGEFHSPPLLAIVVIPFGYPANGIDDSQAVPYALTRALWFYLNVLCLWLSTHWLASLVESADVAPGRWWLNRLLPLLLLIVPLAHSLQAGTADGLLLLIVSSLVLGLVRGQYFATGLALVGAICLQITAVVLLFVPIWRRDRVMSLGIVFGLLLMLLLLPGLYFGLQRTNRLNEQYVEVLKQYEQQALADEQNHSLFGMIKQAIPADGADRDPWAIAITITVLAALTLISCGLMGFNQHQEPLRLLHFVGSLLAIMLLASPQSVLHSFALLVPAIVGSITVASNQARSNRLNSGLLLSLLVMSTLISLPLQQPLLPLLGIFSCWLLNAGQLYRSCPAHYVIVSPPFTEINITPSLPKAA